MFDPELIKYAKVFPPIGIARLGDSESEYLVSPEFRPHPQDVNFRDRDGKIKRQAAKFRLYGFDEDGQILGEITADIAAIEWTVHLANKKAAWFEFHGAGKALQQFSNDHPAEDFVARNDAIGRLTLDAGIGYLGDEERRCLQIDPGPRKIAGVDKGLGRGSRILFEGDVSYGSTGTSTTVYLGELATDDGGRLLVLGGRGLSQPIDMDGAVSGTDRLSYWIEHYANNDHWIDDTSDGVVSATVSLRSGKSVEVRHDAWVIVAPPDFAPDIKNLVTLYDVFEEVAVATQMPVGPGSPRVRGVDEFSLDRDILALMRRANDYRWVSPLGLRGHGDKKPGEMTAKDARALGTVGSDKAGAKQRLLDHLRKPTYEGLDPMTGLPAIVDFEAARKQANASFMPPLSGDQGDRTAGEPSTWFSVTRLQYHRVQSWVKSADAGNADAPADPVEPEPAVLTRTALEGCAGGPFYPGIEISAIVRDRRLYCEAFRFDSKAISPGDITKYMACPWQADFYECRDTWWPAQRPDAVITKIKFDALIDAFAAPGASFDTLLYDRQRWDRGLNRKPLPSRTWLLSKILPLATDAEIPKYMGSIREAALSTVFDATEASRFAHGRDPGHGVTDLPNPWRLQYLVQEQLDRIAGRFFTPSIPAPEASFDETFLKSLLSARFGHATPASLRSEWSRIVLLDRPSAWKCLQRYAKNIEHVLGDYLALVLEKGASAAINLPINQATPATVREALVGLSPDPLSEPADFTDESDPYFRLRAGELISALISELFFDHAERSGDNAMVDEWRSMGFVRKQVITPPGSKTSFDAQVETERPKYDGASFRDYFYYLMNLESFPDFRSYAVSLTDYFLRSAQSLIDQIGVFTPDHPESFVRYTPENFKAKLDQIYEIVRAQAEQNQQYVYKSTRAETIASMETGAVFNQMDGAWLRYIGNAGAMDDVRALLFTVWNDEIGNGNPALHHGNLYTRLMEAMGVHFPDIRSRAYADHPGFFESSFVQPVFELCISLESEERLPELLGMTLFLEWEVLSLVPKIKQRDYLGIDSQFLRMHVGIDNPVDGHGASARLAVERYLANVLRDGGDEAQQEHWARIWRGFVAFAATGYDLFKSVGTTTKDGLNIERARWERRTNPEDRVVQLIEANSAYGSLNHLRRKIGVTRINDLFDNPRLFLAELARSSWIEPGRPDESKFLTHLTTFAGPMYKVFDSRDLEVWRDWIYWLGQEGDTRRPKFHLTRAESMLTLLAELQQRMRASPGHDVYSAAVEGRRTSLAELFQSDDLVMVMSVLRDPDQGFIVPHRPAKSALVVDLMRPGRDMGKALDQRFESVFGQIGRMVVYEWILAGCPLPGEKTVDPEKSVAPQPRERLLFMQQYGMGAVH